MMVALGKMVVSDKKVRKTMMFGRMMKMWMKFGSHRPLSFSWESFSFHCCPLHLG